MPPTSSTDPEPGPGRPAASGSSAGPEREPLRPRALSGRVPPLSSAAALGILGLLLVHAVGVAKPLLLPVVVALLASLVLRPIVGGLARLRVPRLASAILLVAALLGGLGTGLTLLAAPASSWLERAPESLRRLEWELRAVKEPIEQVSHATRQVEEMTSMGEEGEAPLAVEAPRARLADALLSATPAFLGGAAVAFALLLLFLVAGERWPARLATAFGHGSASGRQRAVDAVAAVERDVSAYLLTIAAINTGLGVATALLLGALGLPNPVLWGVMAGVLNFMPYLGAAVTATAVAAVSLLTFEELSRSLLPPLLFLGLTGLEGLVITPQLVGHRLRLHPLAVLLALLAWTWLWGIAGALVAVPLLAVVKLTLEHSPRFGAVARVLEP